MTDSEKRFQEVMLKAGLDMNNPLQVISYDECEEIKESVIRQFKEMGPEKVQSLGVSMHMINMSIDQHIGLMPMASNISDIVQMESVTPVAIHKSSTDSSPGIDGELSVFIQNGDEFKSGKVKLTDEARELIKPHLISGESVFLQAHISEGYGKEPIASISIVYNTIIGRRLISRMPASNMVPLINKISEDDKVSMKVKPAKFKP